MVYGNIGIMFLHSLLTPSKYLELESLSLEAPEALKPQKLMTDTNRHVVVSQNRPHNPY